MSVCIACIPSKILTEEEMLISHDYCKECLRVIAEDLVEFEQERLLRELKKDE